LSRQVTRPSPCWTAATMSSRVTTCTRSHRSARPTALTSTNGAVLLARTRSRNSCSLVAHWPIGTSLSPPHLLHQVSWKEMNLSLDLVVAALLLYSRMDWSAPSFAHLLLTCNSGHTNNKTFLLKFPSRQKK
jgi:hypothetical protein